MIVADTSALISLASIGILDICLTEFETHTTDTVRQELEETSEYEDSHANAADTVLESIDRKAIHQVNSEFTSSRVDKGEGSCAVLTNELKAEFLITDDLRALPELQTLTDAQVAISPIVLKALVKRGELEHDGAVSKLEQLADARDWLGAPIYRRAKNLFE
ncbi:hypothetical protein GJ631_00790 [Natronomonas sp. CBA1123]|uniref:hypothetical protein n=1 Tax=Natronomonas sp. CBA1123 TaxID=2668070 RepID=UPI0012EA72B5|nr:hypothetical protein [Natronomonas sp. CBA1123]MUV85153.1 hypothetical protein [Natronomonas sp. CBA1123]